MKIAIISSSLNKKSRSLVLAKYAKEYIEKTKVDITLLNLQDYTIPNCCPEEAFANPDIIHITKELKSADALIVSTPIYNFNVNGVLKNVLDLTGESWREKVVGFICVAGGSASYMSIMSFANSLMLNFRCLIIPKFVYALTDAINDEKKSICDENIKDRIKELCDTTIKLAKAVSH
jgi:FMN reductase